MGVFLRALNIFCILLVGLYPSYLWGGRHEPSESTEATRAVADPLDDLELTKSCEKQYQKYLRAGVSGLNAMRGRDGMLRDTVAVSKQNGQIKVLPYKDEVAPTDIALDILVQLELLKFDEFREDAINNLKNIVSNLEKWPHDNKTGLLYRLYENGTPTVKDLSSVDNMHYAVALWSLSESIEAKELIPGLSEKAKAIYQKMDFSLFFDKEKSLIGGNLKPNEQSGYELEGYRYHLGSEARTVYLMGFALQNFAEISPRDFSQALSKVDIPINESGELQFWDGGVFQALLPELLMNESKRSSSFRRNSDRLFSTVFSSPRSITTEEGLTLKVPRAPTASISSYGFDAGEMKLNYSGKVGIEALKDSVNQETVDETLVVPHAFLLASLSRPCEGLAVFEQLEGLESEDVNFFEPSLGWMASAKASEGPPAAVTPMPGLVGVDKGIEVLSILRILSANQESASSQVISQHPVVSKRLDSALDLVNRRLIEGREKAREQLKK